VTTLCKGGCKRLIPGIKRQLCEECKEDFVMCQGGCGRAISKITANMNSGYCLDCEEDYCSNDDQDFCDGYA